MPNEYMVEVRERGQVADTFYVWARTRAAAMRKALPTLADRGYTLGDRHSAVVTEVAHVDA